MKNLTSRQKEVLDFISEEVVNKNYPPSVREICQAMNLKSSSTVHAHLKALEKKGYIKRDPTKPRAIEIIDREYYSSRPRNRSKIVPLVGQVTAGAPILAEENIESFVVVPDEMVKGDQVFLLKVKGDSMINAGINDNDLVLIEKKNTAQNKEIVIVSQGDDAVIKRYFKEGSTVMLLSENSKYAPIHVRTELARILGVAFAVIRGK